VMLGAGRRLPAEIRFTGTLVDGIVLKSLQL
jgi:hypothetical protein